MKTYNINELIQQGQCVGHCRGAVYGDVLANLLMEMATVIKEYYINDYVVKLKILLSLFI